MRANCEFRCGTPRHIEWDGFWKASADASLLTEEESRQGRNSLRKWLSQQYLVDFEVERQRHCCVDKTYPETERTLKIIIEVAEVLTAHFLRFVQQWLRQEAPLWRVSIPVDTTDESVILVYPNVIRVNPTAEGHLEAFIEEVRPRLALLIEQGQKKFGIRTKPVPPLPKFGSN
jgi:hypothetical protein